ncbi:MAG: DNA polymerase III subunit delta [Candidatus Peribacteraceae bacterium]|nr:DNA polymerase III subunit delta [Candidatus Peribacteraceae bacterium]MBP9850769.1 DNA polymerase III subunit delta [Candidatus Peribacteraceae bacterium]
MHSPTLHFFTGDNDYALEKEVQRWKKGFAEKHGVENLLVLHAREVSLSDILDAVSAMPFIAEKRLVLIRGVPKIDKEDIQTIADNVHPQVIVAFVESKPDKRLGAVKALTDVAEVKEFKPLSPRELSAWAFALVKAEGGSIDDTSFSALLQIVGADQWTLESELRKLTLFAPEGKIEPKHIDILAVPSGEQVVWKLTDMIGNKRIEEALAFFSNRLERGEDPYGIWVILLNMIKNVTLVWAALQEGVRDDKGIASAVGIHFFAVRGLLPLARSLDEKKIRDLVNWASDADLALKTGGYHYTAEKQGEIIALTERAILMCR